ncbi:cysteine desulfurase [Mycobacteroides abscessus subsp. abscessus]|nr:cysteine desulfurase [Mycobacteroides abscessus subsp. abscessus]SIB17156.1 cysteine desulfurase [Mycobacteroides abscessus subsp. abscessus]SIC36819.1 cysteine desulfurase [Mycobacteroides abscessus subsp. abscessus]SIC80813.1 Probable aminotransferase/cysteine desulfurase [Mycobacteroides abscessus subsp. abscessus]SID02352.1 cysteine desulfurase [Mycobacteroides abscessus subsp. abscessus]
MSVSTQAVSGQPFARVVGADTKVPLAHGGWVRYANFDYAASAPALCDVADRVTELLPYYASVHRGAGYASGSAPGSMRGRGKPSAVLSAPAPTTT